MGSFSFKRLWKKGGVSAVWIFHAVLQSREAADHLTGRNIGPLPQRKLHLLWQSELFFEELCPLCTISAITMAQYKPYSTILLFLPSLICLYLKIHQKQSPVQHLKMVQFCHNGFIFLPHIIQCAFECTLPFCTLPGIHY